MPRVDPSSIVDRHAELAEDVVVGPFCHVHAGVRIGAATHLVSHVVVSANTSIGAANIVHPFTVVGGDAQLSKGPRLGVDVFASNDGLRLEIGDHNVFRESVTVNASSGVGTTRVGSHNLFMAGCHVAHDVVVGSHCVIANAVQLAGHVTIENWVTFGGLSGVAQHLRVGQGAFIAAGAMCERDVPPFVIAQGDRASVRALNVVGLERRGVPPESIRALRRAFASLWSRLPEPSEPSEPPSSGMDLFDKSFDERLRAVDRADLWVALLVAWLEAPERRVRPAKRGVTTRADQT